MALQSLLGCTSLNGPVMRHRPRLLLGDLAGAVSVPVRRR